MQHVYGKIKVASYVELGVVTQCVIDDRYKKKGQDWIKVLDPSVIKNLIASKLFTYLMLFKTLFIYRYKCKDGFRELHRGGE